MRSMATVLLISTFSGACSSDIGIIPRKDDPVESNSAPLPPTTQTDVVIQVTSPTVDVLYVIDHSCSMADKQVRLNNNFPLFMQYFVDSGLDYHIGVVTMDTTSNNDGDRGILRSVPQSANRWIDSNHLTPIAAFSTMSLLGISGSGVEKGRDPAYTALELRRNSENVGFVRDAALQHIIFVGDEVEQSGSSPIGKAEFLAWMRALKLFPDNTTAHSITGLPTGGHSGCYADQQGDYLDYANQTGGITFDICAPTEQWPGFLDELGFQAAGLKREFFLSRLPVPSSIELSVTMYNSVSGQDETFEFHQDPSLNAAFRFTYNGSRNSVTFDQFLPEPFAEITVFYDLLEATISVEEPL